MVTPRRRTTASSATPAPDVNPPTIITPVEGETVEVRETIGSKEVIYNANITQAKDETEIEVDDLQDEDFLGTESYTDYQEPPKNPLSNMFDMIQENQQFIDESFVAEISRQADFMNDGFNIPCNAETSLPPLQFKARDRFTFTSNIQKYNGNSGGRFAVRIYRQNGEALNAVITRPSRRFPTRMETVEMPIGAVFVVPNPTKEQISSQSQNPNNNNNNSSNAMADILKMMTEQQNQMRIDMLKMQLEFAQGNNKPHEPSDIEKQVMAAALQKLMNPESKSNTLEETMATMLMMPTMVEGFSRKMFPETPEPREPTTMDTIKEIAAMPVVDNILGGILSMAEQAANARFIAAQQTAHQNGTPVPEYPGDVQDYSQPAPIHLNTAEQITQDDTDMQDLIQEVIDELESDNALNADNETIKELITEYPNQFKMITSACKMGTFDNVLSLLLSATANLQPNPFNPFINTEETVKQQAVIWTPDGERIRARLEEFYNFVKVS